MQYNLCSIAQYFRHAFWSTNSAKRYTVKWVDKLFFLILSLTPFLLGLRLFVHTILYECEKYTHFIGEWTRTQSLEKRYIKCSLSCVSRVLYNKLLRSRILNLTFYCCRMTINSFFVEYWCNWQLHHSESEYVYYFYPNKSCLYYIRRKNTM